MRRIRAFLIGICTFAFIAAVVSAYRQSLPAGPEADHVAVAATGGASAGSAAAMGADGAPLGKSTGAGGAAGGAQTSVGETPGAAGAVQAASDVVIPFPVAGEEAPAVGAGADRGIPGAGDEASGEAPGTREAMTSATTAGMAPVADEVTAGDAPGGGAVGAAAVVASGAASRDAQATVGTAPGSDEVTAGESPGGGGLTVYFLDVGQAESSLVVCDGEAMLIDGGNADDSSFIYAFLESHGIDHLRYMVATHAHEDHVGGLAGALNYATVDTVFFPMPIEEALVQTDTKAFNSFIKYLEEQKKAITIPKPGDVYALGGATIRILGPLNKYDDINDDCIVLRLVYGATSFLFTGDAMRDEETDIVDAGYELESTVLSVGHHGSDTSTSYVFLRSVMPRYAVISCGAGNQYGHPHEEVLSRLRDADVTVYRTDLQGTITATSDGVSVGMTTER
ncbi:MAG: MBL fold metallo-hydrolase [Lachnospiraceae bacterium]|nr:MBL fold metallo-hydrolase [Lachnospiraceae bacterium]